MRTQKGYSILELLVVMAVFAFLLLAVGTTMSSVLRGARKSGVSTGVRNEGLYALETIASKIKFARSIVSCSESGSSSITVLDSSEQNLVLAFDNVNKRLVSGTNVLTSEKTAVEVGSGCTSVFTCDVGRTTVEICFDVTDNTGSTLVSEKSRVNFKTEVSLRNANL